MAWDPLDPDGGEARGEGRADVVRLWLSVRMSGLDRASQLSLIQVIAESIASPSSSKDEVKGAPFFMMVSDLGGSSLM